MNPHHPWLTRSANPILSTYLKKTDVGLEFGSGRSTLWFAEHVSRLTSVEHDPVWHEKISKEIEERNITNISYYFYPRTEEEEQGTSSEYVQVLNNFEGNSLDFVLVDGIYRCACAHSCLSKLKPGGVLILDNANWYLPSNSFTPGSRSFAQGPISEGWAALLNEVKSWRVIWTSSGVTDTAMFFKPSLA